MIKKLFLLTILSFFALSAPQAFAQTDRVGNWDLNAPAALDFVCGGTTYNHILTTVTNNDPSFGLFIGTGYPLSETWITWNVTGAIDGDQITFRVVYNGSGRIYNLAGHINADGSISGTSDDNCQTFSLPAGTASFSGNHGQYVSSQEDKQEAAHSRIGMPEQSRGHLSEPEPEEE